MRPRRLAAAAAVSIALAVGGPFTASATDPPAEAIADRSTQVARLALDRLAGAGPPRTAATVAPASTSDGRTDPLGDVVGNDGMQTVEPRADISRFDLRYGADRLDISVTVPGGVDPATSANFRDNVSGVLAIIDVNGDAVGDFGAVLVADRTGKVQVLVIPVPPEPNPASATELLGRVCLGAGSFDGASRTYRLAVPAPCIGNAYEARVATAVLFDRATPVDQLDLVFDFAPQARDLPGVHRDTAKNGAGYRFVAADGGIFSFGNAGFFGSTGDIRLNQPIVGMETTRSGSGYWLVARDGGIFTFGDAAFLGSTGDIRLNEPIVAMAATPTGQGYWLVARDGGVFTFGDARFLGSAAGSGETIVGMAAMPNGSGYWLAAASGAVLPFGSAPALSSSAGVSRSPLTGITPSPSGRGYWLAFADGTVLARGDSSYFGEAAFLPLNAPIVGLASTPTGRGYWLLGRDGGVFTYGDAAFHGSTGALTLNQPILDLAI